MLCIRVTDLHHCNEEAGRVVPTVGVWGQGQGVGDAKQLQSRQLLRQTVQMPDNEIMQLRAAFINIFLSV